MVQEITAHSLIGDEMKHLLKIFCIGTLWLVGNAFGVICPSNSNAPLCPTSGSTLLDETYPAQAFVISNDPIIKSLQSANFTSSYINSIAKSYDYENIPQIFVPVTTEDDFNKIVSKAKLMLEASHIKKNKIEKILAQITHIPSQSYTWQQDYFEAVVDLKTGHPVLREFESYTKYRPETLGVLEKIQKLGNECQITKGKVFLSRHVNDTGQTKDSSFRNGEMGGNVEGAPGGFCLTGDNQAKKFATQYCGNEANIIQLQTSWLAVGHVDEIFKIIPSEFNDGRPVKCNFSLMAASPKKALELMNESTTRAHSFYSFSHKLSDEELNQMKKSRSQVSYGSPGIKIICDYIKKAITDGSFVLPKKLQKNDSKNNRSVFLNFIMNKASAEPSGQEGKEGMSFKCEDYIDQIPNENIRAALEKDADLIHLNTAIQESIDKDKELIKSKIILRLPECAKYFDILDVPNLFYGAKAIEENGKFTLPKDNIASGAVSSFLPNPTNSVLMNKTILLPETGNPAFDSYVSKEIVKRKIKTETIDTWDYAHAGQGNAHCSSHSILNCRKN